MSIPRLNLGDRLKTLRERVSADEGLEQAQEEFRPTTPIDYCGEVQKEEPPYSYFNRRPDHMTIPYGEGVNAKPQIDTSIRGSPTKRRDPLMEGSPNKAMSFMIDSTLAEGTRVELPINEEEFEQRVVAEKLELAHKGKELNCTYSQKLTEPDSVYHLRLYQEARSRVRSEVRANIPDKKDVRFSERKPDAKTQRGLVTSQGETSNREHHSPMRMRDDQSFADCKGSGRLFNANQFREDRPLSEQRRPRQSLLLYDIPKLGDQTMPGIQTLLDKLLDKTDLMVIEIVEDATKVCFTRKDDINLHKLGIKLMLPKYNGSDTLEMFLHFVKEATKSLSLAKILREDMGLQTDLLGQMLKGKAQTWYNHTIGNNTNQEISLSEAMIIMKRYFIKDP